MRDVVHVLKKQKQLLDIELGETKVNKAMGYPNIHPKKYYEKILKSHIMIEKAIKLLGDTEEDIYNNYDYIEN